MKDVILPFFFAAIMFPLFSQSVLTPLWVKTAVSNQENGIAEAWGVDLDNTNNVYWAVSTDSLNAGLDVKCYKYNTNGEELWPEPLVYGGPGTQHAYVCNAAEDALYIGGRACTGLINTCDMLLLKVDKSSGSLLWDQTMNFAANGYEEVDGLEVREDGIYCGGWAQELESGIYQSDIGLWKLDFDGNTEWTNYLGEASTAEHQDGHFVVDENNIYAAGLWQGTSIANLYNGYAFLGKFSKTDGALVDSTLFGHQADAFLDIENALGMTTDGEFLYITGYSTPVSADDWQIFVAKYDKNLNQIWYVDWGGSGVESARGISVVNGIIYVAGLSGSSELISGEHRDAVLLTLDTAGNVLNYYTWGDSSRNSFLDLTVTLERIYLTGMNELGENELGRTGFLLALSNLVTSTEESIAQPPLSFQLYPNPANGTVKIDLGRSQHQGGSLRIMDTRGRTILTKTIAANTAVLEVELAAKGLFLVNIDFGDYSVSRKLVNW